MKSEITKCYGILAQMSHPVLPVQWVSSSNIFFCPGLQIRITLTRIRIRINLLSLMRIWIIGPSESDANLRKLVNRPSWAPF